jgi:hypothetical protein
LRAAASGSCSGVILLWLRRWRCTQGCVCLRARVSVSVVVFEHRFGTFFFFNVGMGVFESVLARFFTHDTVLYSVSTRTHATACTNPLDCVHKPARLRAQAHSAACTNPLDCVHKPTRLRAPHSHNYCTTFGLFQLMIAISLNLHGACRLLQMMHCWATVFPTGFGSAGVVEGWWLTMACRPHTA